LDDINSTLTQSERHLNGIKSMFGGLRNYFSGRGSSSTTNSQTSKLPASHSETKMAPSSGASGGFGSSRNPASASVAGDLDSLRNTSHPGLRMRGLGEDQIRRDGTDEILDRNLDEMSMGLSRLKGLAMGLNKELDEHNDILDRLDHKASTTHFRVEKQNKDMNKILKK
jgi:synaptosomal-associated protein 29